MQGVSANAVVAAIKSVRFSCMDEAGLQAAVAEVLAEHKIGYQREVRLSARDRIDFMIDGGVGLELKVKTDTTSLLAQMLRYAEHAQVRELIAASTTYHALTLPAFAKGKRLIGLQVQRW